MAWSNSKVFRQCIADSLDRTAVFDFDGNTFKAALYNNTITPDKDVTAANSAYAAGQWVVGGEQTSSTDWPAGGVALVANDITTPSTGTITFDANDTASGATATLTAYGCLVYSDTLTTPVADQGACYNYFGGAASVVAGTFTVVWSASGIFYATV